MNKKTHTIDSFPKAGPYSHVVEAGDLLFLSGMIPVDADAWEKQVLTLRVVSLIYPPFTRAF